MADATFQVGRSEVFGFLGPNGAGKTTTTKMLTTLLPPTTGSATILGFDLRTQGSKIRERIGVVQQQDSFDQGLNVETSMDLYGLLWNVPKNVRRDRIEAAHREASRWRSSGRCPPSTCPSGRAGGCRSPGSSSTTWTCSSSTSPPSGSTRWCGGTPSTTSRRRSSEGLSIFFTTHILEEAEYLCNRIAVINHGRIVAVDTPANLKRKFGTAKEVEFRFLEGASEEFQRLLSTQDEVESVEFDKESGAYRAKTAKPELVIPEVYRTAEKLGLHVSSVYISETTLEDAFISMIEGADKEAKAG